MSCVGIGVPFQFREQAGIFFLGSAGIRNLLPGDQVHLSAVLLLGVRNRSVAALGERGPFSLIFCLGLVHGSIVAVLAFGELFLVCSSSLLHAELAPCLRLRQVSTQRLIRFLDLQS